VVLFDLELDPREEHDLTVERPSEAERLRSALDAWHRQNAREVVFKQTDEQRRVLEGLGYVGPGHETGEE
jgi:hypothetical protein